MSRELLKQAADKMQYMLDHGEWYMAQELVEQIRAEIAKPEQERIKQTKGIKNDER